MKGGRNLKDFFRDDGRPARKAPQWLRIRSSMQNSFPTYYSSQLDKFANEVGESVRQLNMLKPARDGPPYIGDDPSLPDYSDVNAARMDEQPMPLDDVVQDCVDLFNGMPHWNHPFTMPNVIPPANKASIIAATLTNIYSPNIIEGEYAWNVEKAEMESAAMIADLIGWKTTEAGGIYTYGGSGCYLYGLKYALTQVLGVQSRCKGVRTDGVILSSQQGHYAKMNATDWTGLGMNSIIDIETNDDTNEMDLGHLEEVLQDCQKKGIPVISVICTMGTTDAFAVDPVKEISDLLAQYPNPEGFGKPFIYCDAVIGWSWLFFKGYDFTLNPLQFEDSVLTKLKSNYDRIKDVVVALGLIRSGWVGDAQVLWHERLPFGAGRHSRDAGVSASSAAGGELHGVRERGGQRLRDAVPRVRAQRERGASVRAGGEQPRRAGGTEGEQRAAAAGGGHDLGVVPLGRAGGRAVRRVHQLHVGLPHDGLQRRHDVGRGGVRHQGVPHEREHHDGHDGQAAGGGEEGARPGAGRRDGGAAGARGVRAVRPAEPGHLVLRRQEAGGQGARPRPGVRRGGQPRVLQAAALGVLSDRSALRFTYSVQTVKEEVSKSVAANTRQVKKGRSKRRRRVAHGAHQLVHHVDDGVPAVDGHHVRALADHVAQRLPVVAAHLHGAEAGRLILQEVVDRAAAQPAAHVAKHHHLLHAFVRVAQRARAAAHAAPHVRARRAGAAAARAAPAAAAVALHAVDAAQELRGVLVERRDAAHARRVLDGGERGFLVERDDGGHQLGEVHLLTELQVGQLRAGDEREAHRRVALRLLRDGQRGAHLGARLLGRRQRGRGGAGRRRVVRRAGGGCGGLR
ncbi:glutamate decarboxylase [Gracilaria domingensis]|nr:glutamate decarboxylase [Gracilaria domingensis]